MPTTQENGSGGFETSQVNIERLHLKERERERERRERRRNENQLLATKIGTLRGKVLY
jgi:hypothetical protein